MEPCDSGYGVYFPDLPGCVASGKTIDQAARIAKDALSMHYYALEEESEEIPEPSQSLSAEDTHKEVGDDIQGDRKTDTEGWLDGHQTKRQSQTVQAS